MTTHTAQVTVQCTAPMPFPQHALPSPHESVPQRRKLAQHSIHGFTLMPGAETRATVCPQDTEHTGTQQAPKGRVPSARVPLRGLCCPGPNHRHTCPPLAWPTLSHFPRQVMQSSSGSYSSTLVPLQCSLSPSSQEAHCHEVPSVQKAAPPPLTPPVLSHPLSPGLTYYQAYRFPH